MIIKIKTFSNLSNNRLWQHAVKNVYCQSALFQNNVHKTILTEQKLVKNGLFDFLSDKHQEI